MAWFITKHANESALASAINGMSKLNIALTADDGKIHYVKRGYSNEYLTFESYGGRITYCFNEHKRIRISYDNGATWQETDEDGKFDVYPGNKVMIKGEYTDDMYGAGHFTCPTYDIGAKFKIYGNIMSLVYNDNFYGKTDISSMGHLFEGLFSGCTLMENAKDLILPATTLSESCYENMFMGCTSLKTAPALPATDFDGLYNCYKGMYYGCVSLNYIKMMGVDKHTPDSLYEWVYNVSPTGTFVKKPITEWDDIANQESDYVGVPEGWTIAYED